MTSDTDQITWQCRTCSKTESGSPPPEITRSLAAFNNTTLNVTWPRIVTQYSNFAATRTTDKLPALSGSVRMFHADDQCSYIMGSGSIRFATICYGGLMLSDHCGGHLDIVHLRGRGLHLMEE